MTKLSDSFYRNTDTLYLAQKLLGKKIVSSVDNKPVSGIITETEAYCGISDKACHAYGDRKTKRTSTNMDKYKVHSGPRIGVDYAGKDALLPYRFWFTYSDDCNN